MERVEVTGVVSKNIKTVEINGKTYTKFSVGAYRGKNKDGSYKPTGWWGCTTYGDKTDLIQAKQKILVMGRPELKVYNGNVDTGIWVDNFEILTKPGTDESTDFNPDELG